MLPRGAGRARANRPVLAPPRPGAQYERSHGAPAVLKLADLELATLPMEQGEFARNPFPHFESARRVHPWLAKCAFGYVVHAHEAIRELLVMNDRMEPSFDDVAELMQAEGTEWERFQHVQLLNLSGDAHKRLRGIVSPLFGSGDANRNRPLMRETMTRLLDEWAPRGSFDFEEFVSYFPVTVMGSLLGASPDEIPRLRSSLEALGMAFGMNPELMPQVEAGHLVMDEFVQRLVAERRSGRRLREGPDLMDALLAVTADDGMTDRELYDLLIFLFVAGYDTSKNVLTLVMHVLLDHPEDYARCAEDFEFCTRVVEEALRFHSPATITRRVAREFEYRDVLLPEGILLFFPVNVSGRDPGSFERADEFLPDVPRQSRHLAFGRGVHICLGQFIARAQIEEGLHLLAQRIRNPRLAGPVGHRPFFGIWGLRGLPIEFDPVARA